MSGRRFGEDSLIAWLRTQPATEPIGDDAARLSPRGTLVVTTDTQIAGVHVPVDLDPAQIARRLLAVNMSDIAAMGAIPTDAFLVLAAPPGFDHRRFFRGLLQAARDAHVTLAGGDLASSPNLVSALTLHGRLDTEKRCLPRTDARVGHRVWVGGTIGESRLGLEILRQGGTMTARGVRLPPALTRPRDLAVAARRATQRHLHPDAQVQLGDWLASETPEGGTIDLSDGLARDLGRLCRASEVGAIVDQACIPLAHDAERLAARLGVDALHAALQGGEDYVLCFTLPPEIEVPEGFGCHAIGTIVARRGLFIRNTEGTLLPLQARGWDHIEPDSPHA